MSFIYSNEKISTKRPNERFNKIKISNRLVSKFRNMSAINKTRYYPFYKNRNSRSDILITRVLSVSKSLLVYEDDKEESKIPEKSIYRYPYKPDYFPNLDNSINSKKLLLKKKIKSHQPNLSYISSNTRQSNQSIGNSTSGFNNSITNNLYNSSSTPKITENIFKKKAKFIKKNQKEIMNKTTNSFLNINSSYYKKEITKEIISNVNINEQIFIEFIDNINTDNSYINNFKGKLRQYYSGNNKFNLDTSCFKDLIDYYNWEENENYFTDFYSTKKNTFTIKDSLNITMKLNSLQFIFYEIKYINNKENTQNNNNNNNGKQIKLNTKIKLPFQFLSFFYGLSYGEFFNLLTALIEYDFNKNIFYIPNDIFVEKIDECKTLYDFFSKKSFALNNDSHKTKEYFLYDWDIKDKNNKFRYFQFKILLPRMKMKINCNDKNIIKFYKNISLENMDDFIKYSFNEWDYFILVNFSEHKVFRFEINKILTGKYSKHRNYNDFKNNNLKFNKHINYNLANSMVQINTIRRNDFSYCFFYTLYKDNKKANNEVNFINFILPKISITYNNILNNFHKIYEVGLKKLHQLNKLRKYFIQEDIIKFSMIIKNERNKSSIDEIEKNDDAKNFRTMRTSFFKRKSSSIDFSMKRKDTSVRKFLKKKLTIKKKMINKIQDLNNINDINKSVSNLPKELGIIKDIDLNLEPYIFNYDESILKFIDFKDIHKNDKKDNSKTDKFIIDIANLELTWTDKDGLRNSYKFDKNISHYLLDFPQDKWKNYVENNIEEIILGKSDESKKSKKFSFLKNKSSNF